MVHHIQFFLRHSLAKVIFDSMDIFKRIFCLFSFWVLSLGGIQVYAHGNSEIAFIPNRGQYPEQVLFKADIPGGALFIEQDRFTFHFLDFNRLSELHHGTYTGDTNNIRLQHHAYQVIFENAGDLTAKGQHKEEAIYHFLQAKNPKDWVSNVPSFGGVTLTDVWEKIDLKIYSISGELKYDFIVHPGGNPQHIQLLYEGLDKMKLSGGDLKMHTAFGIVLETAPESFQGKQKPIPIRSKYLLNENTLSFEFPDGIDSTTILTIDPVLIFSSYSGSQANNFGYTATYDQLGFLYSGSTVFGNNYPTTLGAFQTSFQGGTGGGALSGTDVAISKWDTTGTTLIWSTYLGGSSDEMPHSMITDINGLLYVMGTTGSTDFPMPTIGYDTSHNGGPAVNLVNGLGVNLANGADIFVVQLDSAGANLVGGTFLGGNHTDGINGFAGTRYNYADEVRGEIELDKLGNVYIASTTRSTNIPVSGNTFQPAKQNGVNQDGVIFKLTPDLNNLLYTTYLGGSSADALFSIAVNDKNDIYVAGGTASNDIQKPGAAYDTTYNGNTDGYIAHISEHGDTLKNATYYGSINYDQVYFVDLDREGKVYIYGQTSAPQNQLISNAIYFEPQGGQLVAKFKTDLSFTIWRTRFGSGDGTPDISPTAFLVDLCNSVYVSGWGSNIDGNGLSTQGLDTAGQPFQGTTDNHDFYLAVIADDASQLTYGSFIGGSAREHVDGGTSRFDRKGKIYQAVCAGCPAGPAGSTSDFPTLPNPGAVSNTNNATGGCNLAVFKMDFLLPIVLADFTGPSLGCAPFVANFQDLSLSQTTTNYSWTFGDGGSSNQSNPTHTYTQGGTYTIRLILQDTNSCNVNDTLEREITILSDSLTLLPDVYTCAGTGVEIGITNNSNPSVVYNWTPTTGLSNPTIANPVANPSAETQYILTISNGICADTVIQWVRFDSLQALAGNDTFVCLNSNYTLAAQSNQSGVDFYWYDDPSMTNPINSSPQNPNQTIIISDTSQTYYLEVISAIGCKAFDTITIGSYELNFPLEASFIDPGEGCEPYTVQFNNTSQTFGAVNYLWDFGDSNSDTATNPNHTFSKGNFQITLFSSENSPCPQADTFSINISVDADSNYNIRDLACLNQLTQIGIAPDTNANTSYSWTPTTGLSDPTISNPSITANTSSNYLLVVNGLCTDSVQNEIDVDLVYAVTDSVILTCSGEPPIALTGDSKGTGAAFAWVLLPQTDTLNNPSDSTLQFQAVGPIDSLVFFTQTDSGCIESDTVRIITSDNSLVMSPEESICFGDTLLVETDNLFPENELSYSWTPTEEIIGPTSQSSILVAPQTNQWYYLYTANDSGCAKKDSIFITVATLQEQEVNANSEQDTLLNSEETQLSVKPNGYSYLWVPATFLNDPQAQNPIATPDSSMSYTVYVRDNNVDSCVYKSEVDITVIELVCGEPDIYVPNAFTPNADGLNEKLFVRGKNIGEMQFWIFDRWGNNVFETTNINEGWDGTYNDTDTQNAVFTYQLQVTCIDGQYYETKGNITLLK